MKREEFRSTISFVEFLKVDMRVGTIIKAETFPEARKPAYKIWVDFGEDIGILKSSAQITDFYPIESLPGMQIIGVVNFPPKQIGGFMSEFLLLGAVHAAGHVTIIQPEKPTINGLRIA